jgi:hypothetical protein
MIYNSEKLIESRFGTSAVTKFTGSSKFVMLKNDELMTKKEYIELEHDTHLCAKDLDIDPFKLTKHDSDGIQLPLNDPNTLNVKEKDLDPKWKKQKTHKLNKSKVKRRLSAYFQTIRAKKFMFFVTVTFPVNSPDDDTYKYFNTWLTKLRTKKLIDSYLWVAERQKNGTLHFHMLTSSYVAISKYNKLMKDTLKRVYSHDIHAFGGYNPTNYNGIDLAKNRKTGKVANFAKGKSKKSLSRYITKYITKNETVMARLTWHCSRNISVLFTFVNSSISDSYLIELLQNKETFVKNFGDICVYFPENEIVTDDLVEMYNINNFLHDTFT